MPQGLGNFPMYDTIKYSINDRIKAGSEVIDLSGGLKKIQGQQVVYYWYENNGDIILGMELYIRPQGLVVSGLAKSPKHSGPPYATDLYNAILNDSGKPMRILSDTDLSDDAFNLWVRFLQQGHTISIYDNQKPGQTMATVSSPTELKKFFAHDDTDYRRYQFVLSKSGEMIAEVKSYFNTRRMRELSGIPLND